VRKGWRTYLHTVVVPTLFWLPVSVLVGWAIGHLTGDRWDAGYWTAVLFFCLLPSRRIAKAVVNG
jgi:hypothetical protein